MEALTNLNLNYWFFQTIAMLITAILIPNLRITSIFGAILIVIALGFVNSKIWDAALFFQIPNELSYQSVLLLFTNGFIFWLLIKLLPGIEIDGFLAALVAPVVFTAISLVLSKYAHYVDWTAILDKIIELLTNIRAYIKSETIHAIPTPLPTPLVHGA
jgi:putative membrane protein